MKFIFSSTKKNCLFHFPQNQNVCLFDSELSLDESKPTWHLFLHKKLDTCRVSLSLSFSLSLSLPLKTTLYSHDENVGRHTPSSRWNWHSLDLVRRTLANPYRYFLSRNSTTLSPKSSPPPFPTLSQLGLTSSPSSFSGSPPLTQNSLSFTPLSPWGYSGKQCPQLAPLQKRKIITKEDSTSQRKRNHNVQCFRFPVIDDGFNGV